MTLFKASDAEEDSSEHHYFRKATYAGFTNEESEFGFHDDEGDFKYAGTMYEVVNGSAEEEYALIAFKEKDTHKMRTRNSYACSIDVLEEAREIFGDNWKWVIQVEDYRRAYFFTPDQYFNCAGDERRELHYDDPQYAPSINEAVKEIPVDVPNDLTKPDEVKF